MSDNETGGVSLKEGIDLKDLIGDGCTFEVNFEDNVEERSYLGSDFSEMNKFHDGELYDDDCFIPGSGFDMLKDMEDIYDGGKIKKRIIRKGYGSTPGDMNAVSINYNAYLEFSDEPFDSTYIRHSPFRFNINDGKTIPGLNYAVTTMKINEKAQFLVAPDLAYGKMGCLDRIPPNSSVLFEVELREVSEIGATFRFQDLNKEDQKMFKNAYEYALQACTKGNELFHHNALKQAIREYNSAISALDEAKLADYEEQEKQQILLMRALTNNVVAHSKLKEPKKVCKNSNRIFEMVRGTSLKVPPKVYFNNAKALIMLNDLDLAEKRLRIAQRLRPKDEDIGEELIKLDELKRKKRTNELQFAKGFLKTIGGKTGASSGEAGPSSGETGACPGETSSSSKELPVLANGVDQEFKTVIEGFCEEMKTSEDNVSELPTGLNEVELTYIREACTEYGFSLEVRGQGEDERYFVRKSAKTNN